MRTRPPSSVNASSGNWVGWCHRGMGSSIWPRPTPGGPTVDRHHAGTKTGEQSRQETEEFNRSHVLERHRCGAARQASMSAEIAAVASNHPGGSGRRCRVDAATAGVSAVQQQRHAAPDEDPAPCGSGDHCFRAFGTRMLGPVEGGPDVRVHWEAAVRVENLSERAGVGRAAGTKGPAPASSARRRSTTGLCTVRGPSSSSAESSVPWRSKWHFSAVTDILLDGAGFKICACRAAWHRQKRKMTISACAPMPATPVCNTHSVTCISRRLLVASSALIPPAEPKSVSTSRMAP